MFWVETRMEGLYTTKFIVKELFVFLTGCTLGEKNIKVFKKR